MKHRTPLEVRPAVIVVQFVGVLQAIAAFVIDQEVFGTRIIGGLFMLNGALVFKEHEIFIPWKNQEEPTHVTGWRLKAIAIALVVLGFVIAAKPGWFLEE